MDVFVGNTKTSKDNTLEVSENLQGVYASMIIQSFSNLFNRYTKAFNKYYDRRGSLFMPNFKRKEITNKNYLSTIVTYIHRNPVHHGFCKKIDNWPHCSYEAMLNSKSTLLKRANVQKWYVSPDNYKNAHKIEVRLPDNSLFIDY
ncbi:transposase [Marinoscillum sp.]|uniref:transposase n=1 Tax=Marinoscillum sp. TaxID=2024838 RepID=UPI003BAADB30